MKTEMRTLKAQLAMLIEIMTTKANVPAKPVDGTPVVALDGTTAHADASVTLDESSAAASKRARRS